MSKCCSSGGHGSELEFGRAPTICSPSSNCSCCAVKEEEPDAILSIQRKSCEACSKAKQKCSGEDPCARCLQKGLECQYLSVRKRGRKSTAYLQRSMCSSVPCWTRGLVHARDAVNSIDIPKFTLLGVPQDIYWVFFQAFGHLATLQNCCTPWFEFQLGRLVAALEDQSNFLDSEKVRAWSQKHNLTLMSTPPKKCKVEVFSDEMGLGVMSNPVLLRMIPQMQASSAFVHVWSNDRSVFVETNQEFTTLTGYEREDIFRFSCSQTSAVLPWCSHVVGFLVADQDTLLHFLRLTGEKFLRSRTGQPDHPLHTMMSTHIFKIRTKSGTVMECLIQCIQRELDDESEIFLGIEQWGDGPPLFDDCFDQATEALLLDTLF